MRIALTVAACCLVLLLWAMQPAASQAPAPPPADTSGAGNASDAAEKHAKRTACLKEAKSKKLVGAEKTAYLKDCIGGRTPLTSSAKP
jgi:hypothetical protein